MKRVLLRACGVMALLALSLFAADPRELFEAASRALRSGDLTAAEQGFQQVLKAEPRNLGALGNLGVVYLRQGRLAVAADMYRRALKVAPQDPMLNLNLALIYIREENYASARGHLDTVLRVQPENAQARHLLATARIFTGEADKAIPVLEELRSKGDSGTLYLLAAAYLKQGKRDEAGKMFDEMLRSLPPAQAHLLRGRALYDSALFDESVAALEKACEADPELPGVWRELGKVYVSLRRTEDARRAFSEALRRQPDDYEAQYFLGAVLVQAGDTNAGAGWLRRAQSTRPDFWGTYYYLGKAAIAERKMERAIEMLQRAAQLSPNQPAPWYQLSRALKSAGRGDEARDAANRFTALKATAAGGDDGRGVLK